MNLLLLVLTAVHCRPTGGGNQAMMFKDSPPQAPNDDMMLLEEPAGDSLRVRPEGSQRIGVILRPLGPNPFKRNVLMGVAGAMIAGAALGGAALVAKRQAKVPEPPKTVLQKAASTVETVVSSTVETVVTKPATAVAETVGLKEKTPETTTAAAVKTEKTTVQTSVKTKTEPAQPLAVKLGLQKEVVKPKRSSWTRTLTKCVLFTGIVYGAARMIKNANMAEQERLRLARAREAAREAARVAAQREAERQAEHRRAMERKAQQSRANSQWLAGALVGVLEGVGTGMAALINDTTYQWVDRKYYDWNTRRWVHRGWHKVGTI